jgi:acyl transferase domain-containing protein
MGIITEPNVLNDVKKTVERTLKMPSGKLDVDAEFETFGMDSIIAMELMSNLSKQFSVSITPAQFTELNTVKELASFVGASLAKLDKVHFVEPLVEQKAFSQKIPRTAHQEVTSIHRRSFPRQTAELSFQPLLNFIKQKYSIDLTRRSFESLDGVVETLVFEYFDELMQHYGLFSDSEVGVKSENETLFSSMKDSNPRSQQNFDVAIVGISCNFPDAPNAQIFWENLLAQKNSIQEIPKSRWDWQHYFAETANPTTNSPARTNSKWGALVDDVDCFDADFFGIPEDNATFMDPQERLLMQEVYKAFQDGGMDVSKLAGSKTGVFIGYEYSEYEHYLRKNVAHIENVPAFNSSSQTYYLANRLSYVFDFCGPSESLNINCASSAVAVNRAYYSLLNSESNLAIAGGVCLNLFVDDYIAGTQYGMLSSDGTCAVFDDNANGFTRGEGVAAIILKRLDDAKRDNDKIYAVIKSCNQNNRGKANSISEIKHESITNVIRDCYQKAAIEPVSVSYIEVDGYCTKWGDSFEFEGIKNAFHAASSGKKFCALGSLKGNIGHLEPASGIASVIKVALSLHHKKFPATITQKIPSTFIDTADSAHPLYIADRQISFEDILSREHSLVRAGVNSFADSGVNVHILLEEYNSTLLKDNRAIFSGQQLFIFSAKSASRLQDSISNFIDFLLSTESAHFEVAYTLQVGREAMAERLAIIASSKEELREKLILLQKTAESKRSTLGARGIYYEHSEPEGQNSILSLITKDMIDLEVEKCIYTEQWQQIALLWVKGATIPWEKIWAAKRMQRVSLPFYPFAKERYWVDLKVDGRSENYSISQIPINTSSVSVAHKLEVVVSQEWCFSVMDENADRDNSLTALEKIELFIKQELAVHLEKPIDHIAIDKNYLELGVSSLGITGLIQKVNRLLGLRLSPSVVFRYPDIQSFSAYMTELYAEKINNLRVTKKMPEENGTQSLSAHTQTLPKELHELEFSASNKNNWNVLEAPSEETMVELSSKKKSKILERKVIEDVLWSENLNQGNYEKITF